MFKSRFAFLMRSAGLLSLAAVAAALTASADSNNQIPLVGLDSNGNSKVSYIPGESYIQSLAAAISGVNNSVQSTLQGQSSTDDSWQLQTISVGLGAQLEFSLGPIGKVSVSPRVSLLFSDGEVINPVPTLRSNK